MAVEPAQQIRTRAEWQDSRRFKVSYCWQPEGWRKYGELIDMSMAAFRAAAKLAF